MWLLNSEVLLKKFYFKYEEFHLFVGREMIKKIQKMQMLEDEEELSAIVSSVGRSDRRRSALQPTEPIIDLAAGLGVAPGVGSLIVAGFLAE